VIVLQWKINASKYSDNRIFNFVAHIAKIVARILRRRKESILRIHVEKINLDIEEQKNADSDFTANFGHR
jgi:hypothetical protein